MYNEGTRVGDVIRETLQRVDEVIVVDDCSKDDSYAVAKKTKAFVMKNKSNRGAGYTTRAGCDMALKRGADIIVTLDADGQHSPSDIKKLVNAVDRRGYDIVFGSRKRNKSMPFVKRLGNFLLSLSASVIFGIWVNDSQTGFHAFTKDAYPKLRWESDRFGIVSEFVYRVAKNKLRYSEVTVKTIYNEKGIGMTKLDAAKSVLAMVKWRFSK